MLGGGVLVVRRGAKKVFEVHCASDSTVQFGRGRGCVLVGVMGGSQIVVHSVLTHHVVACHKTNATSFYFDDTWMVLVVDSVATAVPLGTSGLCAPLCSASNVHDVCFTERYIVLVERGDVIWVADTAALDYTTMVAVPFHVSGSVVARMPGYENYVKTALHSSPNTTLARKTALQTRVWSPIATHGKVHIRDKTAVYMSAAGSSRDLCTVSINPHALMFSDHAIGITSYPWPQRLGGYVPHLGTLACAEAQGTTLILYTAECTHSGDKHQYAMMISGPRVSNIRLQHACITACVVGGAVTLLKENGTYLTPGHTSL